MPPSGKLKHCLGLCVGGILPTPGRGRGRASDLCAVKQENLNQVNAVSLNGKSAGAGRKSALSAQALPH